MAFCNMIFPEISYKQLHVNEFHGDIISQNVIKINTFCQFLFLVLALSVDRLIKEVYYVACKGKSQVIFITKSSIKIRFLRLRFRL